MHGADDGGNVESPHAQVADVDGHQEDEARDADQPAQSLPFPGEGQTQEQGGYSQELKALGGAEAREIRGAFAEEEGQEEQEHQRSGDAGRPAADDGGPPGHHLDGEHAPV